MANNEKLRVRKRNGQLVNWDGSKIGIAIRKANMDVSSADKADDDVINKIVNNIHTSLYGASEVDIEDLQDKVIYQLQVNGKYNLATKYTEFRYQRQLVRKANTTDDSIMSLLQNRNKGVMEENSNKNAFLASTQRDLIAGETSKDLTKRVLLPERITRAHEEGVLHFHDMDYFIQPIFNCCLINAGDMLDNGTVINGRMIESPKSFQVACTVLTQIIMGVASAQYGGQSVDIKHLGKYLRRSHDKFEKEIVDTLGDEATPEMVKKLVDARIKKELSAGVQTIQYQLNSMMTTNGQAPFITIFLNLEKGYEYEKEVAMIIEEIIRQRMQGIKNEYGVYTTPAFPKLVYVLYEHNNLSGGEYDYITRLAAKCSAKRMYPDYISAKKMGEIEDGNVFSPMGCRSFLSPWYDEDGNVKFEGRFNQGVVSLNLPQIGIVAKGDMELFWQELEARLGLCFEALMCRHKALEGVTSDVSPVHWQHGAIARLQPGETIDKLLHGGYSTISLGYIGLYEVTKLMTGQSHTEPEGKEFALKLMNRLRAATDAWKAETNIGFALYGTPAESLCYRFAEIDKKRFGDIKDVTDKGYYTNSYHVDVREHISAFEKLAFESQFQKISQGGCISYTEIPNLRDNSQAIEELIRFIYDNIMYAEFNTKADYCAECGYEGEMVLEDIGSGEQDWACPNCGCRDHKKLTVVRRTCGYIGENFWNVGKTKEIGSRVLHL